MDPEDTPPRPSPVPADAEPCGLLTCLDDGALIEVNSTLAEWLEYSPEELRGRLLQDLLTPASRIFLQTHWFALLTSQGSLREVELEMVRRDGGALPVLINAVRRPGAPGERALIRMALFVVADRKKYERELIAARRRAEDMASRLRLVEEALREADRRKDAFLATLAHELRNPLAPIRNTMEVLRRSGSNDPAVQSAHGVIDRQLSHLVRLVDDLLDISRISRGKIQLRRETVDLRDVAAAALELSKPAIEAAEHELSVELPSYRLAVDGDATRLAQVLANLLNNAAKYTPRRGHLALAITREHDSAVVRVHDDGVGIPAEMLPGIFEMYTQVEGPTGRPADGLGIGLSLAREIVSMHGGVIEARSAGLHLGTEIEVRLPLAETAQEEPAAPAKVSAPAPEHRPLRVLVVDDNIDSAETLSELLGLSGHETLSAHDGRSALDMARTFRPDAVLLDIGMPEMDGFEVARRMRQDPLLKDVLIIAQTGWGQAEDRRKSKEAGFDHHLVKPVHIDALERLLQSIAP